MAKRTTSLGGFIASSAMNGTRTTWHRERNAHFDAKTEPAPAKSVSTTKVRKNTSHTFHLIMTFCTFGLWGLFVWLPITIWHALGPRRKVKTVTQRSV